MYPVYKFHFIVKRKTPNIASDFVYIGLSTCISYGTSVLVAMIPRIGPFIAPVVSVLVSAIFDKIWYGEEFFGIKDLAVTINGKSIDQWLKDFITWIFGG